MPTAARSLLKCDRCRKDKKRCLPLTRTWPERCDRCKSQGHLCSEAQSAIPRRRPLSVPAVPTLNRLAELRPLASKGASTGNPSHGPSPECSQTDAVATVKTRKAILLLSVAEVVSMAIEELITIATEMITPFIHDTRFSDPRDSMPQAQYLVNELRSFADKLESHALELGAGPCVSLAQAALGSKRFAKSGTWTGDQAALEIAYQKTTSWDTSGYPGLSHVLQTKLLRDQPHLLMDNAESFLLYRENFLAAANDLLNQVPMQVPSSLKSSQFFIPCAFASIPTIATRLSQRNARDCLGRSVSHILYDAKSLKQWLPSDISTLDSLGRTSLYLACYDRSHHRVQQLIQVNAKPNVEAANGLYPLDIAVISGDLKACTTIWKIEAEIQQKSSLFDPIHMDSRYDNSMGVLRRSPMMWAAFFGHDHIVKLLRNYRNTHPNTTALMDGNLCNAIGLAAMRGHKEVIEYLIASGHPCDIVDLCERSPLWHAASGGHLPTAELLLKNHVLLDRQDTDGFTPLAIAAHRGHSEVVDYLQKRVDVTISTNEGCTPLSLAASARHRECVQVLLPPSFDALGTSCVWEIFSMAHSHGYREICKVFHDFNQSFNLWGLHHVTRSSGGGFNVAQK